MDIGIYIADLLRNQDEVSLPGLGTFTKEKIPGSYDDSSNSFTPPSYQVNFNTNHPEFTNLPHYISSKKHLSLSSAEYFVNKFSSRVLDLLENSGLAEITSLGIIRQKNDRFVFEALESFDVAGKFYGLKPVTDLKKSILRGADPAPVPVPMQETVITATTANDSIEDFINFQGQEEEELVDEYAAEPKNNSLLLVILGIFLIGVLVAGLLYFFNSNARNFVDSRLPKTVSTIPASPDSGTTATGAPFNPGDSAAESTRAIIKDSNSVDSVVNKALIEKDPEATAISLKIEIIGATFRKRSEAEAYVKTMKARGLQAKIAEDMPGPLFKVSLASFQDPQTAQNELNRIVKEVEKTAWIAKYKPKKTK